MMGDDGACYPTQPRLFPAGSLVPWDCWQQRLPSQHRLGVSNKSLVKWIAHKMTRLRRCLVSHTHESTSGPTAPGSTCYVNASRIVMGRTDLVPESTTGASMVSKILDFDKLHNR